MVGEIYKEEFARSNFFCSDGSSMSSSNFSQLLSFCDLVPKHGGSEVQELALLLLASCCFHIYYWTLDLSVSEQALKCELRDDLKANLMVLDFKYENGAQKRAGACPHEYF
jgi:hypothetical protein